MNLRGGVFVCIKKINGNNFGVAKPLPSPRYSQIGHNIGKDFKP